MPELSVSAGAMTSIHAARHHLKIADIICTIEPWHRGGFVVIACEMGSRPRPMIRADTRVAAEAWVDRLRALTAKVDEASSVIPHTSAVRA